ncbi:MAG: MFS transporter, partial [Luminiphilus sp.]
LPVLGIYAADLPGASPEKLGIALGAYGLTQACLQLPLGWLSDRVGRRPVVIGGLLLFIAGSLVAAAAESIKSSL